MRPPETFAGNRVVGSLKVADDPSETPHKYIIITTSGGKAFNVHTVAFNGVQWVGGQGRYDMAWPRALDLFVDLGKSNFRPE